MHEDSFLFELLRKVALFFMLEIEILGLLQRDLWCEIKGFAIKVAMGKWSGKKRDFLL